MGNFEIEKIIPGDDITGESPVWDTEKRIFYWSDIDGAKVYTFDPSSGEKSLWQEGAYVCGITLCTNGNLITSCVDGMYGWADSANRIPIVTQYELEDLCFNDCIADHKGRIYAGTFYWGEAGMEKTGKLYLINNDRSLRVVDEGIMLSNGMGISPDNRTLYYSDSADRVIYSYSVDPNSGDLSEKKSFVKVPLEEGIPDGLTVDSEGNVYSAQWYGSQVVIYDPEGKVRDRIALPVTQVSSVGFGGADLTDLYITSAGGPWPSDFMPAGMTEADLTGGSVYRTKSLVQGKADYRSFIQF